MNKGPKKSGPNTTKNVGNNRLGVRCKSNKLSSCELRKKGGYNNKAMEGIGGDLVGKQITLRKPKRKWKRMMQVTLQLTNFYRRRSLGDPAGNNEFLGLELQGDKIGLSGGLALLWREGVTIQVKSFSRFYIDVVIEEPFQTRFTLFYENPIGVQRRSSWDLLRSLTGERDEAWFIGGDFNEVFYNSEVQGHSTKDSGRMRAFTQVVEECGLSDISFRGYKFTFTNKRQFPNEFKARLDRFLGNSKWKEKFKDAEVRHLLASRSVHSPILLSWKRGTRRARERQFKFESMWYRKRSFVERIESFWRQARDVSDDAQSVLESVASNLAI